MVELTLDPLTLEHRYSQAYRYKAEVVRLDGISGKAWLAESAAILASPPDLARALALINRDIAPVSEQRWRFRQGGGFAALHRAPNDVCGSPRVWGYICPGADDRLQLDHAWPQALGGRSVVENAVWLCAPHNSAKS